MPQHLPCRYRRHLFLGKFPGYFSDIATFSFYPTKTLGSFGEGGAIITKNNKLYNKIYSMRDWSKKNNDFFNIGYNYRMPEIIATLLIESLKVLNQDLRKRNIIAKRYTSKLSENMEDIGLPLLISNFIIVCDEFIKV